MSERIKQWWREHAVSASYIVKQDWDELDEAIRENERTRLREAVEGMRTTHDDLCSAQRGGGCWCGEYRFHAAIDKVLTLLSPVAPPERGDA